MADSASSGGQIEGALDVLGQLVAAERLVAGEQKLVIAQNIEVADVGADVDQRDVLVAAVGGQRRANQLECLLRRVGLDVHDARLEAGRFSRGDAILDFFLARRGDQDLDLVGIVGGRAERLEIEVDLVERERDVLVGLGLDGQFELLFLLAGRNDDFLRDDHRGGQCKRYIAVSAAEALPGPTQGVRHLVEIDDIAVGHDVAGERLDRIALEPERPAPDGGQFDELDGRRRDVRADQRRSFRLEKVQGGREIFSDHRCQSECSQFTLKFGSKCNTCQFVFPFWSGAVASPPIIQFRLSGRAPDALSPC